MPTDQIEDATDSDSDEAKGQQQQPHQRKQYQYHQRQRPAEHQQNAPQQKFDHGFRPLCARSLLRRVPFNDTKAGRKSSRR